MSLTKSTGRAAAGGSFARSASAALLQPGEFNRQNAPASGRTDLNVAKVIMGFVSAPNTYPVGWLCKTTIGHGCGSDNSKQADLRASPWAPVIVVPSMRLGKGLNLPPPDRFARLLPVQKSTRERLELMKAHLPLSARAGSLLLRQGSLRSPYDF